MTKKMQVQVAIVMGSRTDLEVMAEAAKVLDDFGIGSELRVISAHRSPDLCREFAARAAQQGIRVIIAGAGKAAHLAGVIASHTTLPVLGVPLDAGLSGLDALLSTAQMPRGVPVACMAVGKAGAANAGLLAAAILALADSGLARKLAAFRRRMAAEIARGSFLVRTRGRRK